MRIDHNLISRASALDAARDRIDSLSPTLRRGQNLG
jgi:hypothetical protein